MLHHIADLVKVHVLTRNLVMNPLLPFFIQIVLTVKTIYVAVGNSVATPAFSSVGHLNDVIKRGPSSHPDSRATDRTSRRADGTANYSSGDTSCYTARRLSGTDEFTRPTSCYSAVLEATHTTNDRAENSSSSSKSFREVAGWAVLDSERACTKNSWAKT